MAGSEKLNNLIKDLERAKEIQGMIDFVPIASKAIVEALIFILKQNKEIVDMLKKRSK